MAELYAHRKRREAREAAIAAGTFEWQYELPVAGWKRIAALVEALESGPWTNPGDDAKLKSKVLLGIDIYGQFHTALTDPYTFEDRVSLLEIFHGCLSRDPVVGSGDKSPREILSINVDTLLCDYGCAVRMVEGQIVPFDSPELFEAVVDPALSLLSAGRYPKVEESYQEALAEIRGNDPADAITDAGRALQEMLTARGAKGNAIGALLTDAKKKGLLSSHDSPLIVSIEKAIDWASSDRSTKGDAHNASTGATLADAWLMVHIVGAVIVRLAEGDKRGE